jgi:hypothetical protein
VIPFADSEELATSSGAMLMEFGTDHRLADPEPLEAMLKGCVGKEQKTSPNKSVTNERPS